MSDNYDIKVAVDARESEKGLKTFEGGLKRTTSALTAFDSAAKQAFSSLDKSSSKVSFAKLANEAASFAAQTSKMSTQLAGSARNLDTFATRAQRAFSSINRAINSLNLQKTTQELYQFNLRIAGISGSAERMTGVLTKLGTAARNVQRALQFNVALGNRNFETVGRQLGSFATQLQKLNGVKVDSSLARNLGALSGVLSALRTPPAAAAQRIAALLRVIGNAKAVPASVAGGLGSISSAMASFRAPSAPAVRNLQSLIQALQSGNAGAIKATVDALRRLNGINIAVPPGTAAQLRQLVNLRNQINRGGSGGTFSLHGIGQATGQLRGLENAFSATYQASTLLRTGMGALTLGSFVEGIYSSGIALNQFNRMINAVATSEQDLAADRSFIDTLTHDLPIGLASAQQSFGKFAVSARLSGESVQETQKIYRSFATAFSVMHLSVADQENAFLALEQMFNKGNIQAKELRRQLGQYLPGAFELLAQAMGKTPGQLTKAMAGGEVHAAEIGKLAELLVQIYGGQVPAALASSQAQLVLFGNEWERFKQKVFRGGFDSGLAAMFHSLTQAMGAESISQAATKIGGAFQQIFTHVGALGALAIENWKPIAEVVAALAGIATLAGSVAVLRMFMSPFVLMFSLAGGIASGIKQIAFAVREVTIAYRAGTVAQLSFAAVASGITGAAIAAAVGVALLGGALYELYEVGGDWEKFKDKMSGMFSGLAGMAGKAAGSIGKPLVDGIMDSTGQAFKRKLDEANKQVRLAQEASEAVDHESMERSKKRAAEQKALADLDPNIAKSAQQLLDKADPIGKENEEYRKQIELIDMLNKRFHEGKPSFTLDDDKTAAMKRRLDYETLAKRNPFAGEVRDLEEELKVLHNVGDARTIENELLQIKKKLLKENKELSTQEEEAIRNLIKSRMDLERGGANGFQRWASQVKDLRESLIDVEKNGVEKLSGALADLSVGKPVDFAKMGQDMLRSLNKALIDDTLKNVFKGMNGNSPLATLFGQNAPNEDAAKATADQLAKNQDLTARQVAAMTVTAQSVTITGANLSNIPGSQVSPSATAMRLPQEPGAGPMSAAPGTDSFSGKVNTPSAAPSFSAGGGGMLVPGTGKGGADMRMPSFPKGQLSGGTAGIGSGAFAPSFGGAGSFKANGPSSIGASGSGAGNTLSISAKDADYIGRVAATEVDPNLAKTNPEEYQKQIAGTTDTMLNRLAKGGFGNSIEDIANGKNQFSKINGPVAGAYGSVENAPAASPDLQARVNNYLQQRAGGAPSSIGGSMFYANPNFVTPNNRGFAADLQSQGISAGAGKSIHYYGNPQGVTPPPDYGVQLTQPTNAPVSLNMGGPSMDGGGGDMSDITGSTSTPQPTPQAQSFEQVAKANIDSGMFQKDDGTKDLYEMGDQFGKGSASVFDTAAATAASDQAQGQGFAAMGNANKAGANGIGLEQSLEQVAKQPGQTLSALNGVGQSVVQSNNIFGSVLQIAGQVMGFAGQAIGQMANQVLQPIANFNEQMLGPTFASMYIATSNQKPTQIGENGTAFYAGWGDTIKINGANGSKLISKSALMKMDAGARRDYLAEIGVHREGGLSSAAVSHGTFPASAFANAHAYADGTAKAARAAGAPSLANGGFPAVLHDNEAVIPLTRGREVPVRLTSEETNSTQGKSANITLNLHGVQDFDSFRKSKSQAKAELASAATIVSQRYN